MIPNTDFPDIRNKNLIHSKNGSCLLVPREADRIRIYMQLSDNLSVLNPDTGRVDKDRVGPEQLLKVYLSTCSANELLITVTQVAQQSLSPFSLKPTTGINWWTLYISKSSCVPYFLVLHDPDY